MSPVPGRSPCFQAILPPVVLAVVFALLHTRRIWQADVFMHLGAGRWMVENGRIVTHDPFSLPAAGMPWVDFAWLAQVLMYLLVRLGDFAALGLLRSVCLAAALWFCWRTARLLGCRPLAAAGAMAAAGLLVAPQTEARPYMFTLLLFPVLLHMTHRWMTGGARTPWIAVPLMALWANLHAAFPAFLLSVALMWVGMLIEARRARAATVPAPPPTVRMVLFITVCAFATLANPHGISIWLLPLQIGGQEIFRDHVTEWKAPWDEAYIPFLTLLAGVGLLALGIVRRAHPSHLLLVLLWAVLALDARRQIPLAALACAPIVALWLQGWADRRSAHGSRFGLLPARRASVAAVFAVLFLGLSVAHHMILEARFMHRVGIRFGVGQETRVQAVETADFLLRERPEGGLFNDFRFGGYFIWRLHPHYRVFQDGRLELYGPALFRRYQDVANADPGWEDILAGHDVEVVVLGEGRRTETRLAGPLAATGRWSVIHRDAQAVVFVRNDGPNADLVRRLAPVAQPAHPE